MPERRYGRRTFLAAAAGAVLTACSRRSPAADGAPEPAGAPPVTDAVRCVPTRPDELGPFYRPGAPARTDLGDSYTISGHVLDLACRPRSTAVIELWQADATGTYTDELWASARPAADGSYRFDTVVPGIYEGRPRHIHLRVTDGGQELVTQHYVTDGVTAARFDLIF